MKVRGIEVDLNNAEDVLIAFDLLITESNKLIMQLKESENNINASLKETNNKLSIINDVNNKLTSISSSSENSIKFINQLMIDINNISNHTDDSLNLLNNNSVDIISAIEKLINEIDVSKKIDEFEEELNKSANRLLFGEIDKLKERIVIQNKNVNFINNKIKSIEKNKAFSYYWYNFFYIVSGVLLGVMANEIGFFNFVKSLFV